MFCGLTSLAASQTNESFNHNMPHPAKHLEITDGRQMNIGRIIPVTRQEISFWHLPFTQQMPSYFEVAEVRKAHNRPVSNAEHLVNYKRRFMHDLEGLIQYDVIKRAVVIVAEPFIDITMKDGKAFAHTRSNAAIINFNATNVRHTPPLELEQQIAIPTTKIKDS